MPRLCACMCRIHSLSFLLLALVRRTETVTYLMAENKLVAKFFENTAKFGYLVTTVKKSKLLSNDIKCRVKSENACYHAVQNLLSSRMLSVNVYILRYRHIQLWFCLFCLVVKLGLSH
jgi:hypothetical protein